VRALYRFGPHSGAVIPFDGDAEKPSTAFQDSTPSEISSGAHAPSPGNNHRPLLPPAPQLEVELRLEIGF